MRSINIFFLAGVLALSDVPAGNEYEELLLENGSFMIDWRGDFSAPQKEKLLRWQTSVAQTVSLLHGELPRQDIRIAIQPYSSANSAVPFARVIRQSPQGVLFYISPDRPLNEFINDWTAYHELSHLFIPYPGMPDIWFSEGLASYYQNILQYRAGLLSSSQAQQKLLEGFGRGEMDNEQINLSLRELSTDMRKHHAYMRVYWSGALYFLEADLALRNPDGNQPELTLDDVLREFGNCCLLLNRRWTGLDLALEFDRIADRQLFTPLYKRYSLSKALPDYRGIVATGGMDEIFPANAHPDNLPVQ